MGLVLAFVFVGLAVIGKFVESWTSYCEAEGHWVMKFNNGRECFAEASKHLDAYGHSAGCKRTDWPTVLSSRIFDVITPLLPANAPG